MNDKIQQIYDDIAIKAFQNYTVSRENDNGEMEVFRLAEIEIYMYMEGQNGIKDIFIHKNIEQLGNEKEYTHYSGFDICLGNEKDIYCGVLVRGIMNDNNKVYGPGRVKYNRKNRKKIERTIKVNYEEKDKTKLFFADQITDEDIDLKNIIFKLPRVNLANTTSNKYLDKTEILNTYLNLKARYLRIENEQFYKFKYPPEEPREIFNAIIKSKS